VRHGYTTTIGHGTPITILKRGPNGSSQIDTQVKNKNTFIQMLYNCIPKILNFRLDQDLL